MKSHYVPAFTVIDRYQRQQAVCGAFVAAPEHTTDPDCPWCRSWLEHLDVTPPLPKPDPFTPEERDRIYRTAIAQMRAHRRLVLRIAS